MRHLKYIFVLFLLCAGCRQESPKEITLLQFNIWQEGTMIEGGFASIVNHSALGCAPDMSPRPAVMKSLPFGKQG